MPKYRHKGRVDVYEQVPEKKSGGWLGGALVIIIGLIALAQCAG